MVDQRRSFRETFRKLQQFFERFVTRQLQNLNFFHNYINAFSSFSPTSLFSYPSNNRLMSTNDSSNNNVIAQDKTVITEVLGTINFDNTLLVSELHPAFEPRHVVLIGATSRKNNVGRSVALNLLKSYNAAKKKQTFKLYFVNEEEKKVFNHTCYSKLYDIPEEIIDLAVLVTVRSSCLNVLKQCAHKKIKIVAVITTGFKEAGIQGAEYEKQLIKEAHSLGIRVIGPNCIGIMNPSHHLNATFTPMAYPGTIAFISQSKSMGTSLLNWGYQKYIGFSLFVSVGAMSDVHWGNILDYLSNHQPTQSIFIYMEAMKNASAFLEAAKKVIIQGKLIVVIKAGKTHEATLAAAAHTGSLAGNYTSFEAAMQRIGVLTANSIEDVFNFALILGKQPILPKGPNLIILTNAGGPAVLATDAAIASGGCISQLSLTSREQLNNILPEEWSHRNPIDILGEASPIIYSKALEIILKDSEIHGILIILSPQDETESTATADILIETLKKNTMSTNIPTKLILVSWMGGNLVEDGLKLLSKSPYISAFMTPSEAATTFSQLWNHSKTLQKLYDTDTQCIFEDPKHLIIPNKYTIRLKCCDIIKKAKDAGRTLLTEIESKNILELYGIPCIPTVHITSIDHIPFAVKCLQQHYNTSLKYVVKLYSYKISHKSHIGGVHLNLDKNQISDSFISLQTLIETNHGKNFFNGITLQPMAPLHDGIELVLGGIIDPDFGPVIMFGSGGTLVEIYKDIAFALPPLYDTLTIQTFISRTRISKILWGNTDDGQQSEDKGFDMYQLQSILYRFGELMTDLRGVIHACDINPLLFTKHQDPLLVLDARFVLNDVVHDILEEKTTLSSTIPMLALRPYPVEYIWKTSLLLSGQQLDTNLKHHHDDKDIITLLIRPAHVGDFENVYEFFKNILTSTNNNVVLDYERLKKATVFACHSDFNFQITMLIIIKNNCHYEIVGLYQIKSLNSYLQKNIFKNSLLSREQCYKRCAFVNLILNKQIPFTNYSNFHLCIVDKLLKIAINKNFHTLRVFIPDDQWISLLFVFEHFNWIMIHSDDKKHFFDISAPTPCI